MQDEFDPDAKSDAAPMTVVEEVTPVVTDPPLKKSELFEAAAAMSGLKKSDAKAAVEAALGVMGKALDEGREMNLLPFGKLAINRTMMKSNGKVTIVRIRQPDVVPKPHDPLAQDDEAG